MGDRAGAPGAGDLLRGRPGREPAARGGARLRGAAALLPRGPGRQRVPIIIQIMAIIIIIMIEIHNNDTNNKLIIIIIIIIIIRILMITNKH